MVLPAIVAIGNRVRDIRPGPGSQQQHAATPPPLSSPKPQLGWNQRLQFVHEIPRSGSAPATSERRKLPLIEDLRSEKQILLLAGQPRPPQLVRRTAEQHCSNSTHHIIVSSRQREDRDQDGDSFQNEPRPRRSRVIATSRGPLTRAVDDESANGWSAL